jgi:hypothetical protein
MKCFTIAEQGAFHTYFLMSSGRRSVQLDESLGEKLAEKERESADAGRDPPSDCSMGPDFDFETKGTKGHQDLAHRIINLVN